MGGGMTRMKEEGRDGRDGMGWDDKNGKRRMWMECSGRVVNCLLFNFHAFLLCNRHTVLCKVSIHFLFFAFQS